MKYAASVLERAGLVLSILALSTGVACGVSPSTGAEDDAGQAGRRTAKRVSFGIVQDYAKGEELWKVAQDFALMRELDVLTWRGSIRWADFEQSPGDYDFAWLENFASLAGRQGITLRPYVASTPEWASAGGRDNDSRNDPPASLDVWASFVRHLGGVLQRHSNVGSLEIYKEPDLLQGWDGSAAAYARLLERSLAVQTRDVVHVPFLPGGLAFPDADWIETVCGGIGARAGGIPALGFDADPETSGSSGGSIERYLDERYDAFLASADRACGPKSIWITATGPAATPGRSEDDQASWWVRAVATFLAEPRIEHIGLFKLNDVKMDRPAIEAADDHLGLIRADGSKKKAFYTIDMLTDLLDTGTIAVADGDLVLEGDGAGTRRHLFVRPDGRRVAFVWTTGPPVTVNLRFVRGAGDVSEYLLDGWRGPAAVTEHGVLEELRLETKQPRVFVAVP